MDDLAPLLEAHYRPDFAAVGSFYVKHLGLGRKAADAPSKPSTAQALYKQARKKELLDQAAGADVTAKRLAADSASFFAKNNGTWGNFDALASSQRLNYRSQQELFLGKFWRQPPLPLPWTAEALELVRSGGTTGASGGRGSGGRGSHSGPVRLRGRGTSGRGSSGRGGPNSAGRGSTGRGERGGLGEPAAAAASASAAPPVDEAQPPARRPRGSEELAVNAAGPHDGDAPNAHRSKRPASALPSRYR